MSNILTSVNDLNNMIVNGQILEAIEKHYHDNVSMQENGLEPTIGKKENHQREQEFLDSILEFRGAKVLDVAAGENISYVTWHFDYTHKEWGVRNYTQVSVQHWKDGKIIKEQFFYGN